MFLKNGVYKINFDGLKDYNGRAVLRFCIKDSKCVLISVEVIILWIKFYYIVLIFSRGNKF